MTKETALLAQSLAQQARAEQLMHHLRQHAVDEAERLGFDVEMIHDEIIFTPKRQDGVATFDYGAHDVKVDALTKMVQAWVKPVLEKR